MKMPKSENQKIRKSEDLNPDEINKIYPPKEKAQSGTALFAQQAAPKHLQVTPPPPPPPVHNEHFQESHPRHVTTEIMRTTIYTPPNQIISGASAAPAQPMIAEPNNPGTPLAQSEHRQGGNPRQVHTDIMGPNNYTSPGQISSPTPLETESSTSCSFVQKIIRTAHTELKRASNQTVIIP